MTDLWDGIKCGGNCLLAFVQEYVLHLALLGASNSSETPFDSPLWSLLLSNTNLQRPQPALRRSLRQVPRASGFQDPSLHQRGRRLPEHLHQSDRHP